MQIVRLKLKTKHAVVTKRQDPIKNQEARIKIIINYLLSYIIG